MEGSDNVRLFTTPIHAIAKGQPVRLVAVGDIPGNSPSYLTVNSHGESKWQSFGDVQIIDTNYLPLSQDAFSQLTTTGATQSNRKQ